MFSTELPTKDKIKLEVYRTPMPYIDVYFEEQKLGLIRLLAEGATFTSDEIGSLVLPKETQLEDIPQFLENFYIERKQEWIDANTPDTDDDCEDDDEEE